MTDPIQPCSLPKRVFIAQTEAEREEIYHLRYKVAWELQRKTFSDLDHECRRQVHSWDRDAILLGIRDDEGQVVGTMRLLFLDRAPEPDKLIEMYDLHEFDYYQPNELVFTSRLMIMPQWRGIGLRLLFNAGFQMSQQMGARFNFIHCESSLIGLFERHGFCRYKPNFTDSEVGYRTPLVVLVRDHDYLRQIYSPFAKLLDPALEEPADAQWFHRVFPTQKIGYVYERRISDDAFRAYLSRRINLTEMSLFKGLTEDRVLHFLRKGAMLHARKGDPVLRRGNVGNTMFLIIRGSVSISATVGASHRPMTTIKAGDMFGILEFLIPMSRLMDVTVLEETELLVLGGELMEKWRKRNPEDACIMLRNLAVIMARRLHERTTEILDPGRTACLVDSPG